MDISKFTTSDWIAITGGIAGVLGAVISGIAVYVAWLSYRRDRADIRLQFEKDRELFGPTVELHGFKKNTNYICLSVINRGRRAVTIENAGVIYLKERGGFIFSDSMIRGVHELKEGKRIDYLAEQQGVDFGNISSFYAKDSVGNVYKMNYAPGYKRFIYTFLDKTHLRVKPSLIKKPS